MNQELANLKQLIYETLTVEETEKQDISAVQTMGVQLTNAVKKDGVTIVQLQNVMNKQVTFNLVKALQIIDQLQQNVITPSITSDVINDVIEHILQETPSLKSFDLKMRQLLIENLSRKGLSNLAIAKRLDCHPNTIKKVKDNLIEDEQNLLVE